MLRMTAKTSTRQTQNGIKFLKNINRAAAKVSDIIIEEKGGLLIKELKRKPPVRNYPDDYPIRDKPGWTSEDQEKAFWATDAWGAGIPTVRDDAMIDAWLLYGQMEGDNYSLIIENEKDYTRFVVGSLAKQISRAARFQQKFHEWTGWELVSPKVQKWVNTVYKPLFYDKLSAAFGQAIRGEFTARAYTSPRKKKK